MDGRGRGGGAELAAGRSPARIQVMADMVAEMVADMEVDKMADMEVDLGMVADIDINMEIQFGERVGHGVG